MHSFWIILLVLLSVLLTTVVGLNPKNNSLSRNGRYESSTRKLPIKSVTVRPLSKLSGVGAGGTVVSLNPKKINLNLNRNGRDQSSARKFFTKSATLRPLSKLNGSAPGGTVVSLNPKKNNLSRNERLQSSTKKLPTKSATSEALPKGTGTAAGGNNWRTIKAENSIDQESYKYVYKTENGITAEESGRLEKVDTKTDELQTTGFYEYTGDDGLLYRVDYVAGKNGFIPKGAHLPKPNPSVIKLLQYLASKQTI